MNAPNGMIYKSDEARKTVSRLIEDVVFNLGNGNGLSFFIDKIERIIVDPTTIRETRTALEFKLTTSHCIETADTTDISVSGVAGDDDASYPFTMFCVISWDQKEADMGICEVINRNIKANKHPLRLDSGYLSDAVFRLAIRIKREGKDDATGHCRGVLFFDK